MAVREIDEEDFLRNEKLRAEVAKIWANPEARKVMQRAQKLADPKAVTPDLDREEQESERLKGVTQSVDEMKKMLADERAEREREKAAAALQTKIDAGIAKLRQQGWTEEGIDGVRKLMHEKGLPDPEDAAILFERLHPPATPIASGSSSFFDIVNPPDNDDFVKALMTHRGESEGAMAKKTAEILGEMRGQPRR